MQMMLKPLKWFSSMMREVTGLRAYRLMAWENTKVCKKMREGANFILFYGTSSCHILKKNSKTEIKPTGFA